VIFLFLGYRGAFLTQGTATIELSVLTALSWHVWTRGTRKGRIFADNSRLSYLSESCDADL